MNKLISSLIAFRNEEDGQDLVEYSLLLSTISLAAVALRLGIGVTAQTVWSTINTALTTATAGLS